MRFYAVFAGTNEPPVLLSQQNCLDQSFSNIDVGIKRLVCTAYRPNVPTVNKLESYTFLLDLISTGDYDEKLIFLPHPGLDFGRLSFSLPEFQKPEENVEQVFHFDTLVDHNKKFPRFLIAVYFPRKSEGRRKVTLDYSNYMKSQQVEISINNEPVQSKGRGWVKSNFSTWLSNLPYLSNIRNEQLPEGWRHFFSSSDSSRLIGSVFPAIIPVRGESKTLLSLLNDLIVFKNSICASGYYDYRRQVIPHIIWSNYNSKFKSPELDVAIETLGGKILPRKEALGFAKAVNTGFDEVLAIPDAQTFLVLNDDVHATPLAFSALLGSLNEAPGNVIVGPVSNNIAGLQKLQVEIPNEAELTKFTAQNFKDNLFQHISAPVVFGTVWGLGRNTIETLGYLDESYGNGNYEDNDYCFRNTLNGGLNLIVKSSYFHHQGQQTFIRENIDYKEALASSKERFMKKFSNYRTMFPVEIFEDVSTK